MIFKLKKMKKNIAFIILIILLIFSNFTYANNLSEDEIKNIICKEYSYLKIEGKDLEVSSDDYINIKEDGTFEYVLNSADKDERGEWDIENYPYDTLLIFNYKDGAVKEFNIDSISSNYLEIVLDDTIKFYLKSDFSTSINSFSRKVDEQFSPIVDDIESVIFWDVSFGAFSAYFENNLKEKIAHEKDPNEKKKLEKKLEKVQEKGSSVPFVVIWLIFGALFFTWKMNFINIRGFRHAISLVKGDYSDPNNKGEVSHFQALTTALSGTVGLGNISGVAAAISLGGAGATFWMIVAGLIGMSSKFVECTLGVKYRKIDKNGVVSGGPMYYLKDGLEKRNLGGLGKFLAVLFAILCIGGSFGGGNMFQANQAFAAVQSVFPDLTGLGPLFGVILAIMVGFVIIGGIKSIAKVTEKVVPLMAVIYVGLAIIIIGFHFSDLGNVFSQIINGAFNSSALFGGFIGVLIVGFTRAAFSNEAGVGSASIAHSAAKTKEPVSEGMVALLEPFIDTVVICTMTAIVIIITGNHTVGGLSGSELTTQAFGSIYKGFEYILAIAILLFAFSTMISWSYYGLKSWTFLFGKSKFSDISYKSIFLLFIIIGSTVGLKSVLTFSDMMILAMAFPNIIGLIILSSEVKSDLKVYLKKLKDGTIKKYK